MNKRKVNGSPFDNSTTVKRELVTREHVVELFGEEWVAEVERNELLGVQTTLVLERPSLWKRILSWFK